MTPPLPDWESVITSAPKSPVTVPIAAWICIAIGAYALVIALILVIRQCVLVGFVMMNQFYIISNNAVSSFYLHIVVSANFFRTFTMRTKSSHTIV